MSEAPIFAWIQYDERLLIVHENTSRTCCVHKLLFLFCFDIQNNFGTQHVLQMLRASEKDLLVLSCSLHFIWFSWFFQVIKKSFPLWILNSVWKWTYWNFLSFMTLDALKIFLHQVEIITSINRIYVRVDMVGTNHDEVLTQRRHMAMGQFCANIFLIRITSTYFWTSEVFKNQSFKSHLFSFFQDKKSPKLKTWVNFYAIIVFY